MAQHVPRFAQHAKFLCIAVVTIWMPTQCEPSPTLTDINGRCVWIEFKQLQRFFSVYGLPFMMPNKTTITRPETRSKDV
ncbi:Uncharacterised protein [Vibrio vulnificus]|nr:Uncharacterised protein [Vibrio vulnificus]